jgi:RNA polymerase sigma-70 factor (family 1)
LNNTEYIQDLQRRIELYEDMKAYRELYDMLFPGLHRFSWTFVKSKEVAEEIVSDVFIKVWQIRARLTEIISLKEYLYIITKNFSLNYLTRSYKNSTVSLDEIDVELMVNMGTPEDLYISEDIMKQVRSITAQLSPRCKIIFQLVKEDNLSYKEVAAILNLSVFTVRNQLSIAVRKISSALPKYLRQSYLVSR